MRWLPVLAMLLAIASPAAAVDYRWTLGFAQGTSEAIIRNASGASLNIYCPSGQTDHTPGMFIESSKIPRDAGEMIDAQIVVDGENHPFGVVQLQFEASGRANRQALAGLVEALARSKARAFTVEFPAFGSEERFSLLDARKALGRGRSSILAGCD